MKRRQRAIEVRYKRLSLRPYPGEILLFGDLEHLKAKYYALTKEPYPYTDEDTGGRFVRVEAGKECDTQWLVYGRKPHAIAHEFSHIILRVFEKCGIDPAGCGGEPFCYLLSQLMLEAR